MHVHDAIRLINQGQVTYKPGWAFTARDHTKRMEDTIVLHVDYEALDTDLREAPAYKKQIKTYAEFDIVVGDCDDETTLYAKVLQRIIEIELHETREFFAVGGVELLKPFHPHTIAGMKHWADMQARNVHDHDSDLQFGVA